MLRIPPRDVMSQVVGVNKGKSAIHVARVGAERERNFLGQTTGREDLAPRQSVETNRCSERISAIRRERFGGWSRCNCRDKQATQVGFEQRLA
jgi:hypothetical protein